MGGFNWTHQRAIVEPYVERYFALLPDVFRDKGREFATSWARAFYPRFIVEQQILGRAERVLAEHGGSNPLLDRIIREANDDQLRAIRCRAFALATLG
jgi:aminopeptidase N